MEFDKGVEALKNIIVISQILEEKEHSCDKLIRNLKTGLFKRHRQLTQNNLVSLPMDVEEQESFVNVHGRMHS